MEKIDGIVDTILENWKRRIDYTDTFTVPEAPVVSRKKKKVLPPEEEDMPNLGDLKYCLQSNDHGDWIKLDGRLKNTLSSVHQSRATTLGIGLNLPDATNSVVMQNGTALGTTTGNNTRMLLRSDLPNVTLNASTSNAGSHTHTTDTSGAHTHSVLRDYLGNFTGSAVGFGGQTGTFGGLTRLTGTEGAHSHVTDSTGDHNHTITIESLNGGVSQTMIDVTPQSLSANTFVYLGA